MLFSTFFSILLCEAKEDLPDGIYICFRTDGSLFNLRCLLTRTKVIEELIAADNRLFKASSSFERLSKRVWQSHLLCLSTKIQAYRAVIVPTLLYDAETWVFYQKQIRLQEQFHQCCLHSIVGIKWQDHVLNKEVLKRASLPSIESILLQVQLYWVGHVTRMEDVCMPKAVFFSEFKEGKHDLGAPKKALQRSAEETACTGRNQPSVMTAGGLRLRELALINEKSQL